jgi:hypothetical protein
LTIGSTTSRSIASTFMPGGNWKKPSIASRLTGGR